MIRSNTGKTGIYLQRVWTLVGLLVLVSSRIVSAADPIVLTPKFSTKDAREVTPTDHGPAGQNAWVEWSMVAPGPTEGHDAVYFFTSKMRSDTKEPTPLVSWVDLATGKQGEIYPGDELRVKMKRTGDADPLEDEGAAPITSAWSWGQPVCGTAGPKGTIYLGAQGATTGRNALLSYDPRKRLFEELAILNVQPSAMTFDGKRLVIVAAGGEVYTFDKVDGLTNLERLPGNPAEVRGLVRDKDGYFYTAFGPAPYSVHALKLGAESVKASPVLPGPFEQITFHEGLPGPGCEVVVGEKGRFRVDKYQFIGGKATKLEGEPDESALTKRRGYELKTDWNSYPLRVSMRKAGEEWKQFPVVFQRAAWDNIKGLCAAPDGKSLYGSGWPTAWVWRFDPRTNRFTMLGRHYNVYEMHVWRDEIWITAYYGIKFLRWRPEEPWTFDEVRHYANKSLPMHSSPWGDKDVCNPRLVCRFRYLKKLYIRRSGGMVVTDEGRMYTGARTPAVEYWDTRYSGAVNWYDAATETIGQIRNPFLHHSVRDACRAGPDHVAVAASQYITPYEPVPEGFSPGKFALVDMKTNEVVLDSSPLNAPLSYCEEGEPGRIVVCGGPGKYGEPGVLGAMFIYDMNEKRVTHVMRLPVKVVWTEYDNVQRFERGPDKRIYFYGRDDQGVALCRVDSRTGVVEPVLRGPNLTDVAVYVNVGACFTFFKDRVYFGAKRLVSLPLDVVIGSGKGETK